VELVNDKTNERVTVTPEDITEIMAFRTEMTCMERHGDTITRLQVQPGGLHWYVVDVWRLNR